MTDQPDTPNQPPTATSAKGSAAGSDGRIPRPAIIVVLVGIIASLGIYGLSFMPGSGSLAIEWDTIEEIRTPPSKPVDNGSFALARSSLSALAPNEDDELIYRVAGVVRIDSGGRKATWVSCDVTSRAAGDTEIARSTKLRAAWPKPSEQLQAQDMPETSFVRFQAGESSKVDLPIRDVARRYTDSGAPTEVEWGSYLDERQNWTWRMRDGTGAGSATLPWLAIFEAENRPRGSIDCTAKIGSDQTRVRIPFRLKQWPIADVEANTEADDDTGDVSNVE